MRRILHELMPTNLEEFGLQSALEDVCQQLQDGVKFTCKFRGLKDRLEKYLELAVYRTVQELAINVIKHARATEGLVEVTANTKEVKIKVSDNGRGIEASKGRKAGIGLASIKSKIKLLNGEVSISSPTGKGTMVEVNIPLPVSELG